MRLFHGYTNFHTRRKHTYYGVLLGIALFLVLSLRLIALYRDAGMQAYQRKRIENFTLQLQAVQRACREDLDPEFNAENAGNNLVFLASKFEKLFGLPAFGIMPVLSEKTAFSRKSGAFGGHPEFRVFQAFWKEYLRFLELFPRMTFPEALTKKLFPALRGHRNFSISAKTAKGWYDVVGYALPGGLKGQSAFILTFRSGENFARGRTLYVLLSLFVVLFVLFLTGVATMIYTLLIKLEKMATQDKLTKALTRGAFLEAGEKEKNRALRKNHPLSLVMVDLDNFKQVNDVHGHNAGDLVLHKVGALVREHIRKYDLFGRWGGDEFVLLLPETSGPEAARVAEKIRGYIDENEGLHRLGVTASIGVYEVEDLEDHLPGIIEKADQKMYEAKEGGRNQVVL